MLGEKNVTGIQNALHLIKSLEVLIASTDFGRDSPGIESSLSLLR